MYASLGGITFSLPAYVSGRSGTQGITLARMALMGGKPRLQRTGDELDEETIELGFHDGFCDPEVELARLIKAMKQGDALPLVLGDGTFVGKFVIEKIASTTKESSQYGKTRSASATVSLVEFVEDEPLRAIRAAKAAKAPGKKKKKKKGKPTAKKATPSTTKVTNKDGVTFTKITR